MIKGSLIVISIGGFNNSKETYSGSWLPQFSICTPTVNSSSTPTELGLMSETSAITQYPLVDAET